MYEMFFGILSNLVSLRKICSFVPQHRGYKSRNPTCQPYTTSYTG
ncbi:hypothetical protein HanRHA438_Chr14g0653461 [Helianthus annuus]|nr:hypothetical protein HanRHA438_Chr14g0653461 [Helianthus annuus]